MLGYQRIAIMGAGSGGSYLYRLLRQQKPDLDISLYDRPTPNPCGVKGCAWGLSRPFFFQLSTEVGLEPSKYVLGAYDHVVINGQRLKADLIIINKPAFVKDVLNGAELKDPDTAPIETFDRIIDATGYERAYLPPVEALPIVSAVQVRVKAKAPGAPTAVFNPRGGYSWLFPAGGGEVHLGSLSPLGFDVAREELQAMMKDLAQDRAVCSCRGKIRGHGLVPPFVVGKVWGIGEAIGLVDPVTAAGIVPAMMSAKLLVEHWDSPADYEQEVLHRYFYMAKEASVLNHLLAGKPLSSGDLFFPKQALDTIGIKPSVIELVSLVVKGARDYLGHRSGK